MTKFDYKLFGNYWTPWIYGFILVLWAILLIAADYPSIEEAIYWAIWVFWPVYVIAVWWLVEYLVGQWNIYNLNKPEKTPIFDIDRDEPPIRELEQRPLINKNPNKRPLKPFTTLKY